LIRFVAIWAGQLISLLGSALTAFALAVFLYRRTGDITDLAVIAAAAYIPQIVVAPYGGVLADRLDRRRLMLAGDAGAAAATAALLWLSSRGALDTWTAAALVAAGASCQALQWPA
jgi:MFS family permease